MFRDVKKWLQKPYYFNPSNKFKFKISLLVGFFVFFFLYFFKPFSLSNFKDYLLIYSLSIGFLTFLCSLISLIVPPFVFNRFFDEDKWVIGKNLIFIFFSVLFIGSVLWVFAYYFKLDKPIKQISYFSFLYYTFLVGPFPIIFYVFYNEYTIRKKREQKAKSFNQEKKEEQKENSTSVTFTSENNKESLEIDIKKLVYITSEGNYASFFILENNALKECILRVTLSKIEESLLDVNHFIRCHKSYIVNTKYVKNIRGNARGYLLIIDFLDFDIPVSRKFSRTSLARLLN